VQCAAHGRFCSVTVQGAWSKTLPVSIYTKRSSAVSGRLLFLVLLVAAAHHYWETGTSSGGPSLAAAVHLWWRQMAHRPLHACIDFSHPPLTHCSSSWPSCIVHHASCIMHNAVNHYLMSSVVSSDRSHHVMVQLYWAAADAAAPPRHSCGAADHIQHPGQGHGAGRKTAQRRRRGQLACQRRARSCRA